MTKQIELSGKDKGKFLLVDDEDYEWMSKFTWYLTTRGYPTAILVAHKAVLGITTRDGNVLIDHKDGNRLNVKKDNLRVATNRQNLQNRKLDKRNKTGYKGVVVRRKNKFRPYVAFIGNGSPGGNVYLGAYATAEQAALAYDAAAVERFGEFARLNFPEKK